MGPIEFSLLMLFILWVCVVFKMRTQLMALHARERMSHVVNEIIKDDSVPPDLKMCALSAFTASADPAFMPWLFRDTFFGGKKKGIKSKRIDAEHAKVLENLMREHFYRVNLLVSAHWYVLFTAALFLLLFYTSIVRRGRSGYSLLHRVEESMIHPSFPNKNNTVNA